MKWNIPARIALPSAGSLTRGSKPLMARRAEKGLLVAGNTPRSLNAREEMAERIQSARRLSKFSGNKISETVIFQTEREVRVEGVQSIVPVFVSELRVHVCETD